MNKPKALRLADELDAIPETVADPDLIQETAAELRRLCAKNETLKQSVARLQQHHATAWNRGHTMGMKANEDTARRALDAVKQDAWGNTQLTEALLKAEAQRDALLEALKRMALIIDAMGDMPDGFIHPSPWRTLQCEEALTQARAAIKTAEETK